VEVKAKRNVGISAMERISDKQLTVERKMGATVGITLLRIRRHEHLLAVQLVR
jgi:hypothetical protein